MLKREPLRLECKKIKSGTRGKNLIKPLIPPGSRSDEEMNIFDNIYIFIVSLSVENNIIFKLKEAMRNGKRAFGANKAVY